MVCFIFIFQQSKTTESILLEDSVLFVAEKIPNPIYDLNDCNVPRVLSEVSYFFLYNFFH